MPRRKITEQPEAKDLPELTAQQMDFVQGILAGKTASDAYRAAYDCTNSTKNTVWCEASKLRGHPSVAQWIDAAKVNGMANCTVTYESHIRELERLKALSINSGNMGAAVQCEQTIGKAAGLHIERTQEVPIDAVQTLKDIAQHQPELAASMAAQHGIPWKADEHATKH